MTAPVPPVDLDQLAATLAAATPGPWVVDADGDVASAVDPDTWVVVEPTAPDAAAIVAAVNAATDLIAELRDLRAKVAAVEALAAKLDDGDDTADLPSPMGSVSGRKWALSLIRQALGSGS